MCFVFIQMFLFNLVNCQQAHNAKQEMNDKSLVVARVYWSILFLPFVLTPVNLPINLLAALKIVKATFIIPLLLLLIHLSFSAF